VSEQDKIKLDIKDIMQHLGLDEERWHHLNSSTKVAINRQPCPLVDRTKVNHTIKMNKQITI